MRFRKAIVILSIALSTVSQRSGGIALEAQSPPDGWRQFGGPDRSFILKTYKDCSAAGGGAARGRA